MFHSCRWRGRWYCCRRETDVSTGRTYCRCTCTVSNITLYNNCLVILFFLACDFCRFCMVIRVFHPRHNGQCNVNNVMDKIWYRNPSKSEVIGRCGGDEKTEWPRRTDKKLNVKKKVKKKSLFNCTWYSFTIIPGDTSFDMCVP